MLPGMRKRGVIIIAAALAVVAALVVALVWQSPSPQIITLSNGLQYRFVGATWGTNHSQPGILAHVVDHLPNRCADYVRKKLNHWVALEPPDIYPTPCLLLRLESLERPGTNASDGNWIFSHSFWLADENGVPANTSGGGSYEVSLGKVQVVFDNVPRRRRILECVVVASVSTNSPQVVARFRFSNPAFAHLPQWQGVELPAVKSAGDVRVTLSNLTVEPNPPSLGPGAWGKTKFCLHFDSSLGTNETWVAYDGELSDATGNRLHFLQLISQTDESYDFLGTLWPGESAWRFKINFKRATGFPAGDLLVFSNLPVSPILSRGSLPANPYSVTNYLAGIPVIVSNYSPRNSGGDPPGRMPHWLVELNGLDGRLSGQVVGIVAVMSDGGEPMAQTKVPAYWYIESMPTNAKYLTVTVAIQKPRSVEFLVKPTAEK